MKRYVKQLLSLATAIALVLSLGTTALAAGFSDMPATTHWAYNALNSAVENNLIKGDGTRIYPEANLKRAEMAALINRAFGATQAANISSFTDVQASAWYYSDIAKAVLMGTFKGDSSNTMRPEGSITRQEAFVALARAIKLTAGNASVLDRFTDKTLIADWAKGAVAAMVSAGYINGADGKLNPTGTITRQEFAQLMYNTVKTYISTAGTVTSVADGNVMVNVAGVTLQNLTVKGDLIVGDGVANGDLTLYNVKVNGRLVVRGGGENSIKIINGSSVGNIVISKNADGTVRVYSDSSSTIEIINIPDGKDGVIIDCDIESLTIEGATDVLIKGAVGTVVVEKEAVGAVINVVSGATVGKLETNANGVTVSGEGKITAATVNGNNTAVNVVGTTVTVGTSVTGTTANGETVEGGTEVVVEAPTTPGGGGVPVSYESQIEALFVLGVSELNSMQSDSVLGFNGTTNTITCNIVSTSKTVDQAISAITTALDGQTAERKQHIKGHIATFVKSITVSSRTLNVSSSTTSVELSTFIISGFNITDTAAALSTFVGKNYTVTVTDVNNNIFTYTLTVS